LDRDWYAAVLAICLYGQQIAAAGIPEDQLATEFEQWVRIETVALAASGVSQRVGNVLP